MTEGIIVYCIGLAIYAAGYRRLIILTDFGLLLMLLGVIDALYDLAIRYVQ